MAISGSRDLGVWNVRNRSLTVTAVAVAAAVLLSSCTSDPPEEGSGGRTTCDTSKGMLVVGVIAPLSGAQAAQGKGIANSTQLAVDQANKNCAVNGYRLVMQSEDDAGDPGLGAQAATKLAVDAKVVGVVSTVSDAVAAAVQPVLDSATIVQVSPGNTADRLSRGVDEPKRQFKTYFRTCSVDSQQGRFAADFLVTEAEKRNIAIVTDGQPYGEALALGFSEQAGAAVATWQRVDGSVLDFAGVIAAVTPFSPDAVYFGGAYSQAAALSKQLAAAGLNIPVMGGNGVLAEAYLTTGGRDGDLATSVGAPVEGEFVSAYRYPEPAGPYGAFAYDAANVIIGALAETVGDKKWLVSLRQELVTNVGQYSGDGATGKIAFDEFGDTTNRLITVHRVAAGKWETVGG